MSPRGRLSAAIHAGPLARRQFRLLTAGQATSTVGDFCYAVALPWLVLSRHGGPALLGAVLACYGVPRTILIPVGGILADKIGPRLIMLGADTVRCLLVAALAVLAATHTVSLLALGPVAALIGAGAGLFMPASMAIIPALLPGDQLQAGNAINGAVLEAGGMAGPAIGGVIVAVAGSAAAFSADAGSFLISALTLAMIGSRPAPGAAAAQPVAAPAETADAAGAGARRAGARRAGAGGAEASGEEPSGSWALLRQSRLLKVIVGVAVAANLAFSGAFEVALPALAHARFGAEGYGAIMACVGAGAVLGALAAARAGRLRRPAAGAGYVFVLGGIATGLLPFLGGLPGAAAATLVFGASNGFGNTVILTLLQQWAPPRLLGRVMSIIILASMGCAPLSVFVTGLLVRHFGATPFFPCAAIFLGGSIMFALTQQEFRDLGTPRTPGSPPAPLTPQPAQ